MYTLKAKDTRLFAKDEYTRTRSKGGSVSVKNALPMLAIFYTRILGCKLKAATASIFIFLSI